MYDVHRFAVRHAQAVDKLRLLPDFAKHFGDFRTAAVHEHDLNADKGKKNDVPHNCVFQVFVDHRIAAVFHNDEFVVIFLNIRKRLG